MAKRFPGIEWFCDNCDASLDDQPGFDDSCGTWQCTQCGCMNTISDDYIFESQEDYHGWLDNQIAMQEAAEEDPYGERLSVEDAALIWAYSGEDEDRMFGYTEEELREALQ